MIKAQKSNVFNDADFSLNQSMHNLSNIRVDTARKRKNRTIGNKETEKM